MESMDWQKAYFGLIGLYAPLLRLAEDVRHCCGDNRGCEAHMALADWLDEHTPAPASGKSRDISADIAKWLAEHPET